MSEQHKKYDLICISAGIMSKTYVLMLKLLNPSSKILILEKLSKAGQEKSKTLNNVGTGHSDNCELNYTQEKENDGVDLSKSLNVSQEFEFSKQLWSYVIRKNLLTGHEQFIYQTYNCN